MPTSVTFNGIVYPVPVQNDTRWAASLTRYLIALGSYSLAPSGGSFTLTADANFGAAYGLLAAYFETRTTHPASAGLLRLAKTDAVGWRNNANGGNNLLAVDSSDNLTYNGGIISNSLAALTDGAIWIGNSSNVPTAQTLTGDVTVTDGGVTAIGADKIVNSQISNSAAIAYTKLNLSGSVLNSDIYASAAIAYSKLAVLTASKVLVSNGSGAVSASAVSSTTLGYLDATSSIQSQLNALFPTASFTDAAVTGKLLTGYVSTTGALLATDSILAAIEKLNGNQAAYLLLTGGSLSGNLTLAGNKALVLNDNAGTPKSVTIQSPAAITTSYTATLPPVLGASGSVLTDAAGNGTLSWVVPSGSGTVNSGTSPQLAFYASSTNAVSAVSADASMNSHKITTLANGSAATDAATVGQIHVRQTPISNTYATLVTQRPATYVETGLAAIITPTSTSSKVLVMVSGCAACSNVAGDGYLTLARGGVNLLGANGFCNMEGAGRAAYAYTFLDSPASVAALTYSVQIKGDATWDSYSQPNGTTASIVLLEVA